MQPGDAATVCVPIDLADLRLMAADGTSFGLLPGEYSLHVGGSAPGPGGLFVDRAAAATADVAAAGGAAPGGGLVLKLTAEAE
eukprot:SAG22_NODE_5996_length_918_cov_1.528694_1_plen_83_part_00